MITPKSPLELAALATVAVPKLRVAGLRPPQYVDELVSVTGIIDVEGNRWTVTSPHDSIGGLEFEDQDALLKRLDKARKADMVPFHVPVPIGFARLKDRTRIIVHNDLGGRFMEDKDFSDPHVLPVSLARALASLHSLPPGIYTGIDLPSYSSQDLRERHLSILDEAAQHTVIPSNLWNRWEHALEDAAMWRFPTVPIHGDLQGTNITVDGGSVRTLSGFTSAHVGDPATDYAWVLAQASDTFLLRFREAYTMTRPHADIHVETRAQLISELAIIRWLLHGVHSHDSDIVSQARSMLADLAHDLGDDQLVSSYPPVTPSISTATQPESEVLTAQPHEAASHQTQVTAEDQVETVVLPLDQREQSRD